MPGYNININAGTAGTAGELPNTNRYLERKFIDNLKQETNILNYAKEFKIPSKSSKVIEFPKLTKLVAATTALANEGVPPAGSKLTVTKTTITLYQYGDFVYLSDLMDETAELNYRRELTVEQSYQSALTLETLVRNSIIAGTNVYYSNGTARTDVNSPITASIIRKAVRYLRRNNVKPLTGLLKGSPNADARALKTSYGMFIHDDVLTDLVEMDGFVDIEQYAGRGETLPNEVGAIRSGVRLIENSLMDSTSCSFNAGGASYTATGMISAGSSLCDVYPSIVFTNGAYAVAKLNSTNVEKFSKKRGSAGTGDPLSQVSSEGWKVLFGVGRHDETKLVRIESAATELV